MQLVTRTIRGSRPQAHPAGTDHPTRWTLLRVYGTKYEGLDLTVPEGEELHVSEYGQAPDGGDPTRHVFPAGTRFRLLDAGGLHHRAVTEIFTAAPVEADIPVLAATRE